MVLAALLKQQIVMDRLRPVLGMTLRPSLGPEVQTGSLEQTPSSCYIIGMILQASSSGHVRKVWAGVCGNRAVHATAQA